MSERLTMRHFIKRAAAAVMRQGPNMLQMQSYSRQFEDGKTMALDTYKHSLLFDTIVGLSESDLLAIAECTYKIRGEIPDHLLFHDFFLKYKEKHPKRDPRNYFPMNLSDHNIFKSYCGTLPLIRYDSWHGSNKQTVNDYEYACLSFVIWADRFIPYKEEFKNSNVPRSYVNYNLSVFWDMADTFVNTRYANFVKERNPKWYAKREKRAKEKGEKLKWSDYYAGRPNKGYSWYGTLIYKPNFRDPVEFGEMMKRLVRTSSEGRFTDFELLRRSNPLFNEFYEKLQGSMYGMFDVSLVANRYARMDSPERFAKMAEDFKELADIASKMSQQFQSFKDSKLIKSSTSNPTLVGELLAREIATNPFKYFSETCFRPRGWNREDSLIFWACQEFIQGE